MSRKRGRQKVVFLGAFWGLVGSVCAQTPGANISDPATLLGAASVSRGGATVASPTVHDSLFQNPAGSAFLENYAVSFGYLGTGDALTASIVDNKSGPIGGGLHYLRRDMKNASMLNEASMGTYARMEERAGFALFGKPGPGFGVGINAKYAYRRSYDARYSNGKNWNGDVGMKYVINGAWTAALTGQNLLEDETGLHPKNILVGAEFRPQSFWALSAQGARFLGPDMSATKISWAVGTEYTLANGIAFRGGYRDNAPWNERFVGLGAGYKAKSFSFDYAAQIPVRGASSTTLHSFGMTGYL